MDLSAVRSELRGADLLNRSGVTLFLVCLISIIGLYYGRSADTQAERTSLLSKVAVYESVAQTELQHLIDLIYRSSVQTYSADTPAISNSFPWVRSIGQVGPSDAATPKASHILTMSLSESSRSLGGQVTFSVLNGSEVLLVLSKPDRDQTVRAIFSLRSLLDFVNDLAASESLGVGVNLAPVDGPTDRGSLTTTLHLGLPGLEFETEVTRNQFSPAPANEAMTLAWLLIGALWTVWLLLYLERRRRVQSHRLIEQQRDRIEAQAAKSTLAEITSSIGHEINQPVAAIETLADTASILVGSGRIQEATETLARLQSETIRVGQIIQTIRRLSSSRGLATEEIDIKRLVTEFEPFATILCRGSSLIVKTPTTKRPIKASVDRTAIEQILTNLITNADEAASTTPHNKPHRPMVRLTLSVSDRHAILHVTDNGGGVPEPLRGHVFDPFMTTKPDGVGVGLSLSRSLAEKHHGWLELADTGSNETTFELRLPLVRR